MKFFHRILAKKMQLADFSASCKNKKYLKNMEFSKVFRGVFLAVCVRGGSDYML